MSKLEETDLRGTQEAETTLEMAIAQNKKESSSPQGIKIIAREFMKDRLALISLIFLVVALLFIFITSLFLNREKIMTVDIMEQWAPPGSISSTGFKYILGADEGGSDILGQLILGARNSITIGFAITIVTSIIGVSFGIISGYFGGVVDTILMRIVDFIMILPITMIIIVLVTIIPKYNVWSFIFIMSLFYWVGKARLFRSLSLSESRRDYISASKTYGTPTVKIMFRELMPNLSSMIITNLTLNFAGNIGIETTLSYLGFGLPLDVPSLGTLISKASDGTVLQNYVWAWLPASLLIIVLMLSINYVGNAMKRSADARQRLG